MSEDLVSTLKPNTLRFHTTSDIDEDERKSQYTDCFYREGEETFVISHSQPTDYIAIPFDLAVNLRNYLNKFISKVHLQRANADDEGCEVTKGVDNDSKGQE